MMKPQRAQRNTLGPQKEWIKGKDIGRRRIDSLVGNEVIFEMKVLEAQPGYGRRSYFTHGNG